MLWSNDACTQILKLSLKKIINFSQFYLNRSMCIADFRIEVIYM